MGVLASILIASGIFVIWAEDTYKPIETEYDNSRINIEENEYIVFKPKDIEPSKGFIFYPGAKVEPKAYSELCSKISEQGYLVVIPRMTLNLAILSPNKAEDIISKYSNVESWAIGGHSLGGVMAANYAIKDNNIKGIVFYASYPQGDKLKESNLKILSLYGSNDGVADLNKVKEAAFNEKAKIVEIEGGNHAGFGNYGNQKGDNKSDITNDEQISESVKLTVEFLNNL